MPSPQSPLVTVIIPVRDEENYIAQCLRSVVVQDYPADRLEILVVDGMSHDRTRDIIAEFASQYPNITLLDNPHRTVAPGLNIGIGQARGDIIVRVDAHSLLESDYVRCCVEYLQKTDAQNVGGLMRPKGENYVGRAIGLATRSRFAVGAVKFHYSQREEYVDTVYLGAFRREVFDAVGLFDERLIKNQDWELNYRIRRAGGKILLTPAIKSWYIPRRSLPALWKQYFSYGFWKFQVLRKHPASFSLRYLVAPAFLLSLAVTGAFAPVSSLSTLLFATALLSYLTTSLAVSLRIAARHGWRYLPALPIVFASIHVAWGLGFLRSLLRTLLTERTLRWPPTSTAPPHHGPCSPPGQPR